MAEIPETKVIISDGLYVIRGETEPMKIEWRYPESPDTWAPIDTLWAKLHPEMLKTGRE